MIVTRCMILVLGLAVLETAALAQEGDKPVIWSTTDNSMSSKYDGDNLWTVRRKSGNTSTDTEYKEVKRTKNEITLNRVDKTVQPYRIEWIYLGRAKARYYLEPTSKAEAEEKSYEGGWID